MDPEEGKPDPGAEVGGEGKETPVMSCRGACTLLDGKGARTGGGEASLELWQNNLSLLLPGGGGCTLTYREILHIDSGDYRVILTGAAGERVHLFHLGYNYEDFLRSLYRLRGEVILKDMLMQEQVSKAGLQGEYSYADEKGALLQKGPCEPRVYETGLVIIPQMEDPRRIPFSEIESIAAENHVLTLTTSAGETIAFSMMGSHLDPLEKALTGAMNRLNRETEKTLRELFPALEPASAGRAAALLRDGRAAALVEIEAISPLLRTELEKAAENSPIRESYSYLKAAAQQDQICLGIKKGLLGDLGGPYFWFLIPMYSSDPGKPGNAIAMESFTAGEAGGQATYFFRICSRPEYRRGIDLTGLRREADSLLREINRGMLSINFRREPVYLSDEKLLEPRYLKYLYSINKLPALRELRSRFIGRVSHSSPEQWQSDTADLLQFNIDAENDGELWGKRGDQAAV